MRSTCISIFEKQDGFHSFRSEERRSLKALQEVKLKPFANFQIPFTSFSDIPFFLKAEEKIEDLRKSVAILTRLVSRLNTRLDSALSALSLHSQSLSDEELDEKEAL
jgi:hypothetical protein